MHRENNKDALKQFLFHLYKKQDGRFWKKIALKAWIEHTSTQKRFKRLKAYSGNYTYRRKMRLLFGGWRGVSHQWFKERINEEAKEYESNKK